MNKIKVDVRLYQFEELSLVAQTKAIDWFLAGSEENISDDDAYDYAKEMILANEYWFFGSGLIADTISYVGEHEKAGVTEFNFDGKIYVLEVV